MSEYFPPQYGSTEFHCPYCQVYAVQHWGNDVYAVTSDDKPLGKISINQMKLQISICSRCRNATLWWTKKVIYPSTRIAPPPNSDMPENVHKVYEEAADVSSLSPRAACALLRLAIEMLLEHLGYLKKNDDINSSIGKMVKTGLDEEIQRALDIVRVTGNEAVHPGKIDFRESTDVLSLFNVINFIANELITQPNARKELFNNLPKSARDGIDKRDGKTE